jgi:hypothetical protein
MRHTTPLHTTPLHTLPSGLCNILNRVTELGMPASYSLRV